MPQYVQADYFHPQAIEHFTPEMLYQGYCGNNIIHIARSYQHSQRIAQGVNNSMYFGRQSGLLRSMPCLKPPSPFMPA